MSPVRILILVVAAVAAIALAFLVRGALSPKPAAPVTVAAPAKAVKQVLVAKRDLAVGTRLTATDFGWQDWPADTINAAYITDGAAAEAPPTGAAGAARDVAKTANNLFGGAAIESRVGAIVREAILSGEPIIDRKLVRGGEGGFMAVVLQPGMRAIAASVTVDTSAGGFILPGDRVDVMQSHEVNVDNSRSFATQTIVRNVRVLAIDQTATPPDKDKSMVGATATLEIPAGVAESFLSAKAGGNMALALRSYADTAGGAAGGVPARAAQTGVRINRGGQISEVQVSQ